MVSNLHMSGVAPRESVPSTHDLPAPESSRVFTAVGIFSQALGAIENIINLATFRTSASTTYHIPSGHTPPMISCGAFSVNRDMSSREARMLRMLRRRSDIKDASDMCMLCQLSVLCGQNREASIESSPRSYLSPVIAFVKAVLPDASIAFTSAPSSSARRAPSSSPSIAARSKA